MNSEMASTNPFSGRGAPVSGSRLVGRHDLLERLEMRVKTGAHCSIVGLPRMGKTSVARQVLNNVRGSSSIESTGYITLDAIRGPVQAYGRILEEVSSSEGGEQDTARIVDHDEAYESFLRCLRKRGREGKVAVVVVDEVDAVVREDFVDAQLFVSRLREVANDRERYGVTFVFVSRRSLDMIQGAVDCSTLAGLCEVIYVQPFQRNGLASLACRSPVPVTSSGLEQLWQVTGGHPYLSEVVMCEALERENGNAIDSVALEFAQHAQAHEFTNQYRQLASLLAHEGMFEVLCELVVGPQWKPIAPHALCLLKHYGVLRSADVQSGDVECMSAHFRDYLMLLDRTMPSWELLAESERQLRYVVQDRMVGEYGVEWVDSLRQHLPRMADTMQRLVDQRTREMRMFGDAASDFILDYAYIGDLKDIVFGKWGVFQGVFGGSRADWERRFQDIMKVRNPMAHHRRVPADVLQEAERSCKAVLARVRGE